MMMPLSFSGEYVLLKRFSSSPAVKEENKMKTTTHKEKMTLIDFISQPPCYEKEYSLFVETRCFYHTLNLTDKKICSQISNLKREWVE